MAVERRGHFSKSVRKGAQTSGKLAVPKVKQPHGGALLTGGLPGHRGGGGRPSQEIKAWIADVQRDPAVREAVRAAASDRNGKNFGAAWAVITKFGILDQREEPTMTPEEAWAIIAERLVEAAKRRKAAMAAARSVTNRNMRADG